MNSKIKSIQIFIYKTKFAEGRFEHISYNAKSDIPAFKTTVRHFRHSMKERTTERTKTETERKSRGLQVF